jgi:ring-1,2-phenylacetyl-CoA epoxidase subunit PaaC
MIQQALYTYLLRLGDDALVLGQRLSEWCGHGPVLEEDIALTNTALDYIGQATFILDHAGLTEGKGRDADAIAFLRDANEFRNHLLCELPNGDYAFTIARQLFFSTWQKLLWKELTGSTDGQLKGIAGRSVKEAGYHFKHSRDWTLRMGDGTEESHRRMQAAFDSLWEYTGELFEDDDNEQVLSAAGIAPLNASLYPEWISEIRGAAEESGITLPQSEWMQTGGRQGRHTEHLGHLLSELQFLQRAYPGAKW